MGVFLYSEKIAQTLLEGEKKRQYLSALHRHCYTLDLAIL